jgi:hypothetical protein
LGCYAYDNQSYAKAVDLLPVQLRGQARLLEKKMGIFSFFAPKRPHMGGQVSFAQTAGSANATNPQAKLAGDDKEWLKYLSSAIRTYRKPGLTLDEEHAIWLKARSRG